MVALNGRASYLALQTRDPRFDGLLFIGVVTTGVYCRPICPARPAKYRNCRFFRSAAAAQEAGFRPCRRCRPETAPDRASWRGTSNTIARAMALIDDGALDQVGVDTLAERLGMGGRQLRRLFKEHLGASPITVAQTRRILFAKQLIQETRMPMTQVALAAGFGSIRRFNETFHARYRCPPTALRGRIATAGASRSAADAVTLRLRYRRPYDWPAMLDHLARRAIRGVEEVDGAVYRRTVSHEGALGTVEISDEPGSSSIAVTIDFPSVRALPSILARARRLLDVGADIEAIEQHLSRDPILAPLVTRRPGLRVPGAWDGFEQAVRTVLGQQVSLGVARSLAARLVELCGNTVSRRDGSASRFSHVFPSPEQLAAADLGSLGMPAARRATLKALARATVADPHLFQPLGKRHECMAKLRAIRGVGEWTTQYIALRALQEPDAFPSGDVGLLRGIGWIKGVRPSPAELLRRAEPWRPWRAYAAQHLWCVDAMRLDRTKEARHG